MGNETKQDDAQFFAQLYYDLVRKKVQELLGKDEGKEIRNPAERQNDPDYCAKAITEFLLPDRAKAIELLQQAQDRAVEKKLDTMIRVRKIYDFAGIAENYKNITRKQIDGETLQSFRTGMLQYALTECKCYQKLIVEGAQEPAAVLEVQFYRSADNEALSLVEDLGKLVNQLERGNPPDRLILDMPYGIPMSRLQQDQRFKAEFPDKEWTAFIDLLFKALNSITARNVYHHDIKPDNIIFKAIDNEDNSTAGDYTAVEPKILPYFIDFDVSAVDNYKHLSPRQILDQTPPYASPEIKNEQPPTLFSDYFSMCVTALRTLYPSDVLEKLMHDYPKAYITGYEKSKLPLKLEKLQPIPPECRCKDEALIRTLLMGISHDPTQRTPVEKGEFEQNYMNVADRLNDLKGASEPTQEEMPPPVPPRKKIARIALIVAAVAAVAGIADFALRQNRHPEPSDSLLIVADNTASVPDTTVSDAAAPDTTAPPDTHPMDTGTAEQQGNTETVTAAETDNSTHSGESTSTVSRITSSETAPVTTPTSKPVTTPTTPTSVSSPATTAVTSERSDFSYTEPGNYAVILGAAVPKENMSIPATLNGKPVTKIAAGAFAGNTALKTISLPDSVTEVGANAFANCSALSTITFSRYPSQLSIGERAFYGCALLTEFTIPAGMRSIGAYAFANCNGLSKIAYSGVPAQISFGDHAFYQCTALTEFTVPAGTQSIGEYCFSGSGLTKLKIEQGITRIWTNSFNNCTRLKSVYIPDGVTHIEGYAFYNTKQLAHIRLPASIENVPGCIGNTAFYAEGCATRTLHFAARLDDWEDNVLPCLQADIEDLFGPVNSTIPNCNYYWNYDVFMSTYG